MLESEIRHFWNECLPVSFVCMLEFEFIFKINAKWESKSEMSIVRKEVIRGVRE